MPKALKEETLAPRDVPERSIPVPKTASPQLQRAIAAASLIPRESMRRTPRTEREWQGFIDGSNALTLQRQAALREMFPVEVARLEIAGVTVRQIIPQRLDPAWASRVVVHLHGGAYVINGGEAGLNEGILCASHAGVRVLSVDYRMPPEHPFPAALDDVVAVWREFIGGQDPRATGLIGTSAGGGLALAAVMKFKALGLPLPGALAPGTPWADLAGQGDTYQTHAYIDGVIPYYDGVLEACARAYAGSTSLENPLVSPVNGDFTGFPPSILTSGTRDILLSDTVRVYRAMRSAGVEARLELHEALSHAEYNSVFDSPESAQAFADIAAFFDGHLAR